jgi:hypothetical protein
VHVGCFLAESLPLSVEELTGGGLDPPTLSLDNGPRQREPCGESVQVVIAKSASSSGEEPL